MKNFIFYLLSGLWWSTVHLTFTKYLFTDYEIKLINRENEVIEINFRMDLIREELDDIIQKLCTSGSQILDQNLMKQLKSICR